MYFWKIKKLKADLREGPLTQKAQFQYLLAGVVLMSLMLLIPVKRNSYDFAMGALGLMVAVLGTFYIYDRNGRASGERLLERYVSIGFVMSVRWGLLLFLPAGMALGIYKGVTDVPLATSLEDVIILTLLTAIFYWRIGLHIGDVASQSEA